MKSKGSEIDVSVGGKLSTRVLYADGVKFANALPLLDFDTNPMQLFICEECGVVGCNPHDWLALRHVGDTVVFMPNFSGMEGDWPWGPTYWPGSDCDWPPDYVMTRGVPYFSSAVYQKLRDEVPGFPLAASTPALTAAECLRLLHWEAPLRVLGRFPEPSALQKELFLAVDEGDLEEELSRLDELIADNNTSETPVSHFAGDCTPLTFYLDGPGFPEWSPLCRGGAGQPVLHLGDGLDVALRKQSEEVKELGKAPG